MCLHMPKRPQGSLLSSLTNSKWQTPVVLRQTSNISFHNNLFLGVCSSFAQFVRCEVYLRIHSRGNKTSSLTPPLSLDHCSRIRALWSTVSIVKQSEQHLREPILLSWITPCKHRLTEREHDGTHSSSNVTVSVCVLSLNIIMQIVTSVLFLFRMCLDERAFRSRCVGLCIRYTFVCQCGSTPGTAAYSVTRVNPSSHPIAAGVVPTTPQLILLWELQLDKV